MSFNAKVQLGILNLKEKTFNKKVKTNKKIKRKKLNFYDSKEWMSLRYLVIVKYGRKCMCCGSTNSEIHVDQIKPRSLYPELELDLNNLQVLCKSCNLGKSNKDLTDFRVTNA